MKADFTTQTAHKIDVILAGQETIGSAERSCDKEEMRHMFHTISDGQYRDILYREFSKERVDKELDEFLDREFFPRYGGGNRYQPDDPGNGGESFATRNIVTSILTYHSIIIFHIILRSLIQTMNFNQETST